MLKQLVIKGQCFELYSGDKTEQPQEKIKNDLAGENIPQQGGMKMPRREKPDADKN
jgi:hypothetical protein